MDQFDNPFVPGVGTRPLELVGRDDILERFNLIMRRVKNKKYEKSLFLVGLRGVGKTVLLNECRMIAEAAGCKTVKFEACEDRSFSAMLIPQLRQLLLSLDKTAAVKKALGVLRGFLDTIKIKEPNLGIESRIDFSPEEGVADSGDLESDIPALFESVARAAAEKNTAAVLLIDEVQYLQEKELSALIMAVHHVSQLALPLTVIGAGLPQLRALTGNAKSYAERLFSFPRIGALSKEDAAKALQAPVKSLGVTFSEDALQFVFESTHGYPYFMQEWGYHCWNLAEKTTITVADAEKATAAAIKDLDENFFNVRFDRLSPGEKDYARGMASLGKGVHKSGDVAALIGLSTNEAGVVRDRLIKKGMIYSPEYGTLEFTVPLFHEFMCRVVPDWKPKQRKKINNK